MPASGTYSVEAVRVLDTHRTPIKKQPEALLCLVGISRRYYLGDDVYPTFHYDDDQEMDLFSLIRAPNPTKVKTGSHPRAPHELPLLTLTAPRVIEMDEPAAATNSSGVPSAIERSPLDFADEAEASGRETAAPEMPPPEEVPSATAPGGNQAAEIVAVEPPAVRESHKRGHEGIDANAPPKSLRRDHADLRPSGSSRGGKSLADMQLCLASNVAMGSRLCLRFEQEAKLLRKSVAQMARREQRIQARESEIKNLEALLETEADMKRAAEEKSAGLSQELERMCAQFSEL
nr:transposase (putative), gypsy type [Tanacetum cinerariifolium]